MLYKKQLTKQRGTAEDIAEITCRHLHAEEELAIRNIFSITNAMMRHLIDKRSGEIEFLASD